MISGRQRKQPATPRLLGIYPVPRLHLVGADLQAGPRAPSRWPPVTSPMQHGLDYSFAHRHGLAPVRWRSGTAIIIRLASEVSLPPYVKTAVDAIDAVVTELRGLTGLALQSGQPLPQPIDIRRVPEHEIHVAYLPSAAVRQVRRLAGDRVPSGDAVPTEGCAWYERGWAIVDTDLTIDVQPRPDDLSVGTSAVCSAAGFALLRHQLCHALGLGHAARRQALMHHRIPLNLDGYSCGDRYGLAMLGDIGPVPQQSWSQLAYERTIPCC
jgi:hypothetical protein